MYRLAEKKEMRIKGLLRKEGEAKQLNVCQKRERWKETRNDLLI